MKTSTKASQDYGDFVAADDDAAVTEQDNGIITIMIDSSTPAAMILFILISNNHIISNNPTARQEQAQQAASPSHKARSTSAWSFVTVIACVTISVIIVVIITIVRSLNGRTGSTALDRPAKGRLGFPVELPGDGGKSVLLSSCSLPANSEHTPRPRNRPTGARDRQHHPHKFTL